MSLTLKVGQSVVLDATPVTNSGSTAKVETARWASEGTAALLLSQSPANPLSVTVYAQSAGVSNVSCVADADLGEGVREISSGIRLTVVDDAAVALEIRAGEATGPSA